MSGMVPGLVVLTRELRLSLADDSFTTLQASLPGMQRCKASMWQHLLRSSSQKYVARSGRHLCQVHSGRLALLRGRKAEAL